MADYRFVSEWHVAAPRERVWDALLTYRAWPEWWKGFRAVEQVASGDERGIGLRLRQQWRSVLPYTLRFDLEISDLEPGHLLAGPNTSASTAVVAPTRRRTLMPPRRRAPRPRRT
jgi:uncharacterized protein YndB with AHSA1/START domain